MKNILPFLLAPVLLFATIVPAAAFNDDFADYEYDDDDLWVYWQHLDAPRRHPYSYGGAYYPKTVFGSYGESDVADTENPSVIVLESNIPEISTIRIPIEYVVREQK